MSSGLDRVLGDHPGLAVLEQPVVVRERVDRDLVDAGAGASSRAPARGRGRCPCLPWFDRRLLGWPRHDSGDATIAKTRPARPGADGPATAPARRSARSTRPPSRRSRWRCGRGTPRGHRGGVRLGRQRARHRPAARRAASPPARGCCSRCCCPTTTSTGRRTPARASLAPATPRPARAVRAAARRRRGAAPPTSCSSPASRSPRPATRLGRGGGSYDRALARVPVGTFTCVLLHDDEVGLARADRAARRGRSARADGRGVVVLSAGCSAADAVSPPAASAPACPRPPPRRPRG